MIQFVTLNYIREMNNFKKIVYHPAKGDHFMKTAIMTDTNSGISKSEGEKLGIFVIPMPVIIEDIIYYEGVNLSQEYFYQCLTEGKNISTSQPSPGDVMNMWNQILDSGYDELIYIPMSSGLSNSCETAISLADEYNGKVQVANNHRISVTMRESIMEAKSYADNGMNAFQIKEKLEENAYNCSIYIAVDTLEFLKKGGRVTAAGAALGTVLNIKPILTIQGEKLDAFAKVRGMKKCHMKIIDAIQNDLNTRFKDIPTERIRLGAAGAGLAPEEIEIWKQELSEAFPQLELCYDHLSLCVGAHTGPGAIGTAISILAE